MLQLSPYAVIMLSGIFAEWHYAECHGNFKSPELNNMKICSKKEPNGMMTLILSSHFDAVDILRHCWSSTNGAIKR